MLLVALFPSDGYTYLVSCFPSAKHNSTMKTSSIITFLALSFSFFVVISDAKGLKHRTLGMMMSPKRSKSSPPPSPPPPARVGATCPETCESIVEKEDIGCNYLECIGHFECQDLNLSFFQGQAGFKSEAQCNRYCTIHVIESCPQGIVIPSSPTSRTTSTPTSRCIAARCT
jgi:hypothetical protein